MVKRIFLILVFIGIILYIPFTSSQFPGYAQKRVVMNNHSLTVYVADTEVRKIQGLSGASPLRDTEGMLFSFPKPGRYGFWMKDMRFPLDFIYIKDRRVVEVLRNVQPNSYPRVFIPKQEFNSMIEVKAGVAEKIPIHVGDKVIYNE